MVHKRLLPLAFLLLFSTLSAAFFDYDYSCGDFSVSTTYGHWFQKADIRHRHDHKQPKHICYNSVGSTAFPIIGFNICDFSGCFAGLGYHHTDLKLHHHRFLETVNYNIASTTFGYFTQRWDDWRILFQATMNIDADRWRIGNSTSYDFLSWGRVACFPSLNLHLGSYVETGLGLNKTYPILGFDWWLYSRWHFYAVYPFKVALTYHVDNRLSLSVRSRFFTDRQRDHKTGSAWRYTNAGFEFNLHHNHDECFIAEGFIGYALLGRLKIVHTSHHHHRNYHINPSMYYGAIVTYSF